MGNNGPVPLMSQSSRDPDDFGLELITAVKGGTFFFVNCLPHLQLPSRQDRSAPSLTGGFKPRSELFLTYPVPLSPPPHSCLSALRGGRPEVP